MKRLVGILAACACLLGCGAEKAEGLKNVRGTLESNRGKISYDPETGVEITVKVPATPVPNAPPKTLEK